VISHSKHAAALAHMQQLLDSAGALAPPWLEAEELHGKSAEDVDSELCQAAHKMGGVMPIDV